MNVVDRGLSPQAHDAQRLAVSDSKAALMKPAEIIKLIAELSGVGANIAAIKRGLAEADKHVD